MSKRPAPTTQAGFDDRRIFAEAAACHRRGDLAQAEGLYRALLKRHGKDPQLRETLGLLLTQQGRHAQAIEQFQKLIAGGHRTASLYNSLSLALSAGGQDAESAEAAKTAARLEPDRPELQVNLGNRLKALGLMEQAIEAYGRAVALDGQMAAAQVGLGNAHAAIGDRDRAVVHYRQALAARPDHIRAFYHLALTAKSDRDAIDRATLARFRARAQGDGLALGDRILLHNALGFVADRRGDFAAAFAHFSAFNQALREQRMEQGRGFERAAHGRLVERIIAAFPEGAFAAGADPMPTGGRPLLIVGMPRSGTTLVEQILGSHPAVAPGGELPQLGQMAASIAGYPDGLEGLSRQRLGKLAADYRAVLTGIDGAAPWVTDKMPQNFLHLGLVARLLPDAVVVHCRRDPVDSCLSCYFQNFAHGNDYATDLSDLASYYRDYHRLMAHWRRVLPRAPVEVVYEELVADPEATVRCLLEAAGLTWDTACLAFTASRRPVMTASQWQVRQPIYSKAVGRWRNYRDHLEPLLEALGDLGGDT